MPKLKKEFYQMKQSQLPVIGAIAILLFFLVLLWHGNATSMQAQSAMIAQVYFAGEYRIEDGPWQEIVEGEHIPATKGDVTLRGNFHMLTPDGEYIGIYNGDMPIALYADHIQLTVCDGENEPYIFDIENAVFGDSTCGIGWSLYPYAIFGEEPIEIR
ncbi:MAG: hypothetical protein IKU83_00915, partial [Lachnospiraceae bacterium]|nr:hypothetical protein [Lachnospiraceae bacterium]